MTVAELFSTDERDGRSDDRPNDPALPTREHGGARRDRTDDLLLAKQALSQLSYGPARGQQSVVSNQMPRLLLITDY
jgi:hypothetical protein